jgi:hypothetical protein
MRGILAGRLNSEPRQREQELAQIPRLASPGSGAGADGAIARACLALRSPPRRLALSVESRLWSHLVGC